MTWNLNNLKNHKQNSDKTESAIPGTSSGKHAARISENVLNNLTPQDVIQYTAKSESNILKRQVIENVFSSSGCMVFTKNNENFINGRNKWENPLRN